MEANNIQELVFSFMDLVGISLVQEREGIWRGKIPEKEQPFFNGFEELHFTFQRDVAERHRDLELICEGSYLLRKIIERLGSIPKVTRLFKICEPELPPINRAIPGTNLHVLTPGMAHYRQKVHFNFKVTFKGDLHQERLISVQADTGADIVTIQDGLEPIDPEIFREVPDPDIPIDESGEDTLRLYLKACRELEEFLDDEISQLKADAEEQFTLELEKVESYLEEQKQELKKKKENVCYHLYFFQKEEEIDRMILSLENEQQQKIEELKEKYFLSVEVNLVNAIVLCIPTHGQAPGKRSKRKDVISVPSAVLKTKAIFDSRPAV